MRGFHYYVKMKHNQNCENVTIDQKKEEICGVMVDYTADFSNATLRAGGNLFCTEF